MKILFITAFPPNQRTAGQDYSRCLIEDLCNHGHKVSLIYATYPHHELELSSRVEVIATIAPLLMNCIHIPYLHPFYTKRYSKRIATIVRNISKHYDMIYFDFSQVHVYSMSVEHHNKVLMCHDVIWQKFSRSSRIQCPWIKGSEGLLLKTATKIVTFSIKDSDIIRNLYGLKSDHVNLYIKKDSFNYQNLIRLYNEGCDINMSYPKMPKCEEFVKRNLFCFYGSWNRKENVEGLKWFFDRIYPNISTKFNFNIIGDNLSPQIKGNLSQYRNVKYLGFVDNPIYEIAKCQALVAPIFKGAGVKVKVIDALSCGTPVIGTDIAFEGIEDNCANELFFKITNQKICIDVFNNWVDVDALKKQKFSDDFCQKYDKNHFIDLIF